MKFGLEDARREFWRQRVWGSHALCLRRPWSPDSREQNEEQLKYGYLKGYIIKILSILILYNSTFKFVSSESSEHSWFSDFRTFNIT